MEMAFLKKLEEIERRRFQARFKMKPFTSQYRKYYVEDKYKSLTVFL